MIRGKVICLYYKLGIKKGQRKKDLLYYKNFSYHRHILSVLYILLDVYKYAEG
jgi:hypothetical protein